MTPHLTTGVTPSSLFIGRELRTHLNVLSPDVEGRVLDRQATQKANHDKHSHARELRARNFHDGSAWVPATVADQVGPLSYLVQLPGGGLWHRQIDHLRAGCNQSLETATPQATEIPDEDGVTPVECTDTGTQQPSNAGKTSVVTPPSEQAPTEEQTDSTEANTPASNESNSTHRNVPPIPINRICLHLVH